MPRYIAITSGQDMMCRVLAVKTAIHRLNRPDALAHIEHRRRPQVGASFLLHAGRQIGADSSIARWGATSDASGGAQNKRRAAPCRCRSPARSRHSAKDVRSTARIGSLLRSHASDIGSMAIFNSNAPKTARRRPRSRPGGTAAAGAAPRSPPPRARRVRCTSSASRSAARCGRGSPRRIEDGQLDRRRRARYIDRQHLAAGAAG